MTTMIHEHFLKHWDLHAASGTATFISALEGGFSLVAIIRGICVGVGVYFVTSLLKFLVPKVFK